MRRKEKRGNHGYEGTRYGWSGRIFNLVPVPDTGFLALILNRIANIMLNIRLDAVYLTAARPDTEISYSFLYMNKKKTLIFIYPAEK